MFRDNNENSPISPKGILFDMDGVLLDSMRWHVRAWQDAFEEMGFPSFEEDLFYRHEGAVEPENAVEIFRCEGVKMTSSLFSTVFRRQKEIFKACYSHEVRPYTEVPSLLEMLAEKGWQMGVVTSTHRDLLSEICPEGVLDFMSVVVTGDEVSRRKPFPDPYLKGIAGLGIQNRDAIVVENAPAGIKAAKNARAVCLALATTLEPEFLEGADMVLADHHALGEKLQSWGLEEADDLLTGA